MGYDIDVPEGTKIGSGGSFAPLPAGKYQATIVDAEVGEFKSTSKNAGRKNLNIQFRIMDVQFGANRRLFQTVGLFPNWNPTDKNPDGADNWYFFQLFSAAQGKKEKDFRNEYREAVEKGAAALKKIHSALPSPEELTGKQFTLDVRVEADTYAYNKAKEVDGDDADPEDYKRNSISAIRLKGELNTQGADSGASSLDTVERVTL